MNDMRGFTLAETELCSFDHRVRLRCSLQRPDRYRLIEALPSNVPRIARGSGVSYVAASFGTKAITQDLSVFNRLLDFDAEYGLLRVEAGARISDVVRFALGRGWYLPIVPGHPAASIGGCIAADVHGKNPARDGTFRAQVEALELWHPARGALHVNRSENIELFSATCAGFGLTGTILNATLRLSPAPKAYAVARQPVGNLMEAATVMREHANASMLYGWHDGRPNHFGRGVIHIGEPVESVPSKAHVRADLSAQIQPFPLTLWNRAGIAAANTWFTMRWCRAGRETVPLIKALFPLNAAEHYFAGFGQAGFVETQWLIPYVHFCKFSETLTELIEQLRPRISLLSSKLFAGIPEGFNFDGAGISLALHLPAPDSPSQRQFIEALTELAIVQGGRPNLIKDSTLSATTLRRAIPGADATRAHLRAFDPDALHQSELSRRLAL